MLEGKSMTAYEHKPIDESSPPALREAFSEACERHSIAADQDQGFDLTTVLWHAFSKGLTTKDELTTFVMNLLGK
jgi:hypothetical protein